MKPSRAIHIYEALAVRALAVTIDLPATRGQVALLKRRITWARVVTDPPVPEWSRSIFKAFVEAAQAFAERPDCPGRASALSYLARAVIAVVKNNVCLTARV